MSEIITTTWNAQNAFNDKERRTRAIDKVLAQEADIVGVFEFSKGLEEDEQAEYLETFTSEGYQALIEPYFDKDKPTPFGHHRQEMMAMVRGEGTVSSFEAGNRIAMHASTEGMEAILVHHEDVNEAERLIGATAVLDFLQQLDGDEELQVVAGDFNSIDRDDTSIPAQTLRLIRPSTELIRRLLGENIKYYEKPDLERFGKTVSKMGAITARIGSLTIRLAGMSEGEAIEEYKNQGFKQTDPNFTPTIGLGRNGHKIVKLDHFLLKDPSDSADIKFSAEPTDLSDHSIIKVVTNR